MKFFVVDILILVFKHWDLKPNFIDCFFICSNNLNKNLSKAKKWLQKTQQSILLEKM